MSVTWLALVHRLSSRQQQHIRSLLARPYRGSADRDRDTGTSNPTSIAFCVFYHSCLFIFYCTFAAAACLHVFKNYYYFNYNFFFSFCYFYFIFFFWKSHCQIASFCLRKCKLFFCCFVFLKLELVERLSLRLYVSAGEWVHLPSGSSGTTTATKFRLISVGIEIF